MDVFLLTLATFPLGKTVRVAETVSVISVYSSMRLAEGGAHEYMSGTVVDWIARPELGQTAWEATLNDQNKKQVLSIEPRRLDDRLDRVIPNTLSIGAYLHCGLCLDEWTADREISTSQSPREYASLEVGWTRLGLQVWCKRHEVNVLHIDFEGIKHKADSSRPLTDKEVENARQEDPQRFCPGCQADLGGNDPHDPECPINE